ncbi:HNH endonuclease [Deinococcus sp.]|uniref:HNH endonuclease n=1 Tax=Deinococcus sp. TaxID=47478 RepID=UPI003CC6A77F
MIDPEEFSVEEYKIAIQSLQDQREWTDVRQRMLTFQHSAHDRTIIEPELTYFMGWSNHAANLHYGTLGYLIASEFPDNGDVIGAEGWYFLSSGEWRESNHALWNGKRSHWTMRPALAQALEELGLVSRLTDSPDMIEPEFGEVPPQRYAEGASRLVTVNAYERNQAARKACIAYHGSICAVCDSDTAEFYGPIADDFIHVHHLKPLSEIGERYSVNPETDLVPVCPNCHAMLHRRTPPHEVEELRAVIQEAHR